MGKQLIYQAVMVRATTLSSDESRETSWWEKILEMRDCRNEE